MVDEPSDWQSQTDDTDLMEDRVPSEPMALFADWYAAAQNTGMIESTAMTLATVDPDGTPSARIILLKGANAEGFRFYSNYESHKGRALAANPAAALVFWWEALERQVRVTGAVEKLDADQADAYFERRSRGSQLGAHASPQSRALAGRAELDARLADTQAKFAERDVPRPDHWGGYLLVPQSLEFWQARKSRLHDRIRYVRRNRTRDSQTWQIERLAP